MINKSTNLDGRYNWGQHVDLRPYAIWR
jgi:hypothetical protein